MEAPASSWPAVSLVIPAYNEEHYLPRLLDTVEVARQRYAGGADKVEVIVANNMSTDRTAELAAARGSRVVTAEKRVIGAVRNAGAKSARGEILTFVDADSRIHPETFNVIARAIDSGRVVGGATGVTLERWSLGLAVTYAVMVPMVVLTGMDTGVVFCRRADFEQIGGYDEERLFAEDVQFLVDLRRLGKRRKQRLARLTEAKAVASARKFDKYGEWHYFTQIFRLGWLMLRHPSATTDFARKYWYEDR